MSKAKNDIFISYAEKDLEIADRLYNDLKWRGLFPWMESMNIVAGQNRKIETRNAIRNSSNFLALFSSKSVSETGCIHEQLQVAVDVSCKLPPSRTFIIPVRLDVFNNSNESVHEKLQGLQWIDLFPSYQDGLKKILLAISANEKSERESPDETPENPKTVLAASETSHPAPEKIDSKPIPRWFSAPRVLTVLCFSALIILSVMYFYDLAPFQNRIAKDHIASGNSFLDIDQYIEAKKEYQRALELDPENIKARTGLSKVEVYEKIYEGHYETSIIERRIKRILSKNPDDSHAYVLLGHIYSSLKSSRASGTAISHYEKAIDIDPSVASAYFGLGVLHHKQGRPEKALEMFKQAVNLSKLNTKYLNNLAYLYYKTGQYQKAIETYEEILNLDYEFLLSYYEISNLYRLIGDWNGALRHQQKLLEFLADKKISTLPKNKDIWYFETNDEPVYLYTLPEKKSYAYYSLSLTLHLLGQDLEAETYVKKADGLKIDKDSLLALVFSDLMHLQNENPSLKDRMEIYRERFLH